MMKKRIQKMTFENGGLYNNIEPIPINKFISYSI